MAPAADHDANIAGEPLLRPRSSNSLTLFPIFSASFCLTSSCACTPPFTLSSTVEGSSAPCSCSVTERWSALFLETLCSSGNDPLFKKKQSRISAHNRSDPSLRARLSTHSAWPQLPCAVSAFLQAQLRQGAAGRRHLSMTVPLARGMKPGPELAHDKQGTWHIGVAGCRLRMGRV